MRNVGAAAVGHAVGAEAVEPECRVGLLGHCLGGTFYRYADTRIINEPACQRGQHVAVGQIYRCDGSFLQRLKTY